MKKFKKKLYIWTSGLIILSLSVVIGLMMYVGMQRLPVQQYFSSQYTNAVWDWSNPIGRSQSELRETALFLYRHQINVVYLDISPTAEGEASPELVAALDSYISALSKYNIRVYASSGNVEWSKPDQRYKPLAVMDFVYDYNSQHTNKFSGIEFDIESYNQVGFADATMAAKGIVLTEYLDMADSIIHKQDEYLRAQHNKDFDLGFAVPYWFDNENKNIPSVTWLDKTGPVGFHLMDRLNSLPKSNTVVMAYRNAARGNDGVILHATTEMDYARYKASNVKVIVGLETTKVEPAKITFYGQTATDMSREMRYLTEEFGTSGVLGGTAINDLAGYQAMPQ